MFIENKQNDLLNVMIIYTTIKVKWIQEYS